MEIKGHARLTQPTTEHIKKLNFANDLILSIKCTEDR